MSDFVFWALITVLMVVFVAIVTGSAFWATVPLAVALAVWDRGNG